MLTEEQKDEIADRILMKWDACAKFFDGLVGAMHEAEVKCGAHKYESHVEKFTTSAMNIDEMIMDNKEKSIHCYVRCPSMTGMRIDFTINEIGWFYLERIENGGCNRSLNTNSLMMRFLGCSDCSSFKLTDKDLRFEVINRIDTHGHDVVRLSKWLDMPWKDDLAKIVERAINLYSEEIAEKENTARKRENENDNALLKEFGMKSEAKSLDPKRFEIVLNEVNGE